jgi:hypothetical protein
LRLPAKGGVVPNTSGREDATMAAERPIDRDPDRAA